MSETSPPTSRKVMASFATQEAAENAVQYLTAEAIPRDQINIRTSDTGNQPVQAPGETDGVMQEDEHRNLRTMGTSLASAGAGMAAAGVVIATGGAALPAVAAAAAAGLGIGAASQGVAAATSPDVVPDAEKSVATLTVSAANADQAERAKGVLSKVSAVKVWEE